MSGAADIRVSSIGVARGDARALTGELLDWARLAVGALAVAGVFALLLALSRTPGMDKAPLWPIGFFYKGLVIHVVFSLVIWLMAVFAFLVSVATGRVAGESIRAAPLGRIGQGVVLVAFPCLFAPAFLDATLPELTNYVPLIRHPAYDLGLILLALGVLAPVVRLFVNLPGRARPLPALSLAMGIGGGVYALALAAFAIAGVLLARRGDLMTARDSLFWGGGHILQFVYAIVLLTNWRILARRSLGETAVDERAFRLAVWIVGAFALPALAFYWLFEPFSNGQHDAFRFLQFGVAAPTLIFALSLAASALALARPARWPWRDPAFFTLVASLALFALGGVMGFLITGSDTRTPAHYHAVITAVSVSSAGMLLTFGLDELGRMPVSARAVRALIALYAGGQFVASIAMFVAGGYGAARKTPTGVGSLDAVAATGMAVHGIASIFTIIGGAAFVIVAIRALWRADATHAKA
jgi:cytochrome c oxidase subunit I